MLPSGTHLYNPLCLSDGPSVRRSALAFSALQAVFALLLLPKCLGKPFSSLPLPTRTRLR